MTSWVQFWRKSDTAGYTPGVFDQNRVKSGAGQSAASVRPRYKTSIQRCRGSAWVYPVLSFSLARKPPHRGQTDRLKKEGTGPGRGADAARSLECGDRPCCACLYAVVGRAPTLLRWLLSMVADFHSILFSHRERLPHTGRRLTSCVVETAAVSASLGDCWWLFLLLLMLFAPLPDTLVGT